ncbi:MAG TPA: bifunctional 5,10-methylenetetrahydrofolate dehydrogenase/5,10-methenyltetrahydrofolate cyclohydrolase [Methylomirabilota bacterium]|nr:bifunctional 5,10-methylenetetrahydrofolate dehydrogenase/5,10-methenyltetrahydrofolate cyclohydrolase [Methylomirabilota bacterium]
MKLIGKDIAEKIYVNLRKRVGELKKKNIIPHLVVILVGENPASMAYVLQKQKNGEEIGAKVTVLRYNESVTTEELSEKIKLLNDDPFVHGILIQRPLPTHIDIGKLELLTNPEKDIDGFHPNSPYTLPLPLAVVKILEEVYALKTKGRMAAGFVNWLQAQNIVVTGKGPTGGGPIITYLKTLNITPHIIDSKTPKPQGLLNHADIIIAAVGRENMIKPEMLKKGVILIGVGILRGKDGKLHGDYNEEDVQKIASYFTPTPGGVGPVNVAMLIDNLLTATDYFS